MIRYHCNLCDLPYRKQDDMQTTTIEITDCKGNAIEKTINVCKFCADNIALEIPIGQ